MLTDRLKRFAQAIWHPERASTSLAIFGVVAFAFLTLGYLVATSYAQQGSARDTLVEGDQAIRTLRAAEESALMAETAQRGYLITGNSEYLAPYIEARDLWPQLLDQLEEQDPDFDADRAEMLSMLKKLQQAKLEEIAHTLRLYQGGNEAAAIESVRQDLGQALMEDYQLATGRYETELSTSLASDRMIANLERGRPFLLLGALFLFIMAMLIFGYYIERRRAYAEQRLAENQAIAEAHERTSLLARELNHRVNNLFSVVQAIVSLAARRHDDKDELVRDVRDRIQALSRAHAIARGDPDQAGLPLDRLIATVLGPYIEDKGGRVCLPQCDLALPVSAVTPLGLILHEMATNAAKYGALSTEGGRLTIEVSEQIGEDGTRSALVCWSEHGVTVELGKEGFGTTMMQAAAKQLRGDMKIESGEDGIRARLCFPFAQ